MKTLYQSLLLSIGALALAGTAFAQVPSTNDTSDGGRFNTGMGTGALGGPAPMNGGLYNTASGYEALFSNTTGNYNTASGAGALAASSNGMSNTASGAGALESNTSGSYNTASGVNALLFNTTGTNNTASGYQALDSNTTGNNNTASGNSALFSNTTGFYNTASGVNALLNNTTGNFSTASGASALASNTTGTNNTASGESALAGNTTGSNNIAMGYLAGLNLTTGSNDIDIGNVGVAGEDNTIRIGTKGTHKATVIAGIISSKVTGSAVYVTTTGRLGVLASSERFKTAIAPMGSNSGKLQQLRPVTFHLKTDPKGALQYGLIAEEVAKVYPELVIRSESGRIDGVRYDELAPMLLNEVQKKNAAQDAEIRDLKQQVAELNDLKQELHAALLKLRATDEFVAQR
jgi:hypothetical protein